MIDSIGEEEFLNSTEYEYLQEPKVPPCFVWVYTVFIEIYNHCGETLTWSEIKAYCDLRQIVLSQLEIDYILKMNGWANSKIKEMRED